MTVVSVMNCIGYLFEYWNKFNSFPCVLPIEISFRRHPRSWKSPPPPPGTIREISANTSKVKGGTVWLIPFIAKGFQLSLQYG
jgi:hypothetical protein